MYSLNDEASSHCSYPLFDLVSKAILLFLWLLFLDKPNVLLQLRLRVHAPERDTGQLVHGDHQGHRPGSLWVSMHGRASVPARYRRHLEGL